MAKPSGQPPSDPPATRLSPRRLIIGIAVAILVLLFVGWLLLNTFNSPPVTETQRVPDSPASSQPTRPTSLEEIRSSFGPWETAVDDSGSADTIVMLQSNGAIQISSYEVDPQGWPTTQFDALKVDAGPELVRLQYVGAAVYVIKAGQPFILESQPNRVYSITQDPAGGFLAVSQPTEWVQTHATKGK